MADEPFANPVAPANHNIEDHSHQARQVSHQPLTNADFRKLLMTPRLPTGSSVPSSSRITSSVRASKSSLPLAGSRRRPVLVEEGSAPYASSEHGHRDRHSHKKSEKKKEAFKPSKPKEKDVLSELALRYRDRAKERRDGANPDYNEVMPESTRQHQSMMHAPDLKSRLELEEKRRREIEESKFLGGDMEHTHLVKGLDYALLQKVRAEIAHQQGESDDDRDEEDEQEGEEGDSDSEDDNDDNTFTGEMKRRKKHGSRKDQKHQKSEKKRRTDSLSDVLDSFPDEKSPEEDGEDYTIKSLLAANIIKLLNQKLPERNDLFLPRRMAYLVDTESPSFDDIPLTVIRSRAECHGLLSSSDASSSSSANSLSTNDIVINKLVQIISSHRKDNRGSNSKNISCSSVSKSSSLTSSSVTSSSSSYSTVKEKDKNDRKLRPDGVDYHRTTTGRDEGGEVGRKQQEESQTKKASESLSHSHQGRDSSHAHSHSHTSHHHHKTTSSNASRTVNSSLASSSSVKKSISSAADLSIYDDLEDDDDYVPSSSQKEGKRNM